ncbi:MAG: sigma-54-dependent Fis family transcriptional regulator [Chitinophagaceae bacterium]|nr:MAG: sigma-54-dependent Fis family transcriptional regulator [Chitinophagaceae bacterium]
MKNKVLIVEDQFIEANNLQMILERAGYDVCGIARSVPAALKLIDEETPGLVLLDIFLQGNLTGIDLAIVLKQRDIAFVYLSANSNKETLDAAKATRPYGFLVKPFREKDVLIMLEIARYLHERSLDNLVRKVHNQQGNRKSEDSVTEDNFLGIIGRSAGLKLVLHHLKIVAPTDTSVLILGESGTGKERIAECIHELSPRKKQPLIKVNCAALPGTLIESILFGHEKGAFTGATDRRRGKFEQAHKGTIFLDEIGEMTPDLQVKLLRTLQEKEIERVGGSDTIKVDVRIITATNRNLEKEVAEGRFRMDLYYRLNVFPLNLPPLRERPEDIPLLAKHFIEQYSRKLGKPLLAITDYALQELIRFNWPGNVRELEHVIERTVLLAQETSIKQVSLPRFASGTDKALQREQNSNGSNNQHDLQEQTATRIKTIEENERDHIIEVLRRCEGRISGKGGAAELLGINVNTLNSRIKKLGIFKSKTII